MNLQEQNTINELLFRLLDNEISDRDLLRLNEWLGTDPDARVYYCQFMEDTSALTLRASVAMEPEEARPGAILEAHFWEQLYEEEKNAPALEMIPEKPSPSPPTSIPLVSRKQTVRRINKASLSAAILSAAALLFVIVSTHFAPPASYEVATLVDCIDAQEASGLPLESGLRITTHSKPIRLTQGVVKLITDQSVEVVLEAPSEFTFVSYSEILLRYGKLFARVSEQGLGFSVATPNSRVVDLGTEFGVLCHINGDTEVYVYKGKANLFAGQKNAGKTSQFLVAGSARKVHHKNSGVQEIALEENVVVQEINSKAEMVWKGQPLRLDDVVSGGNGFGGGTLNTGIDVATGQIVCRLQDTDTHVIPGGYRSVPGNPYVDGVFMPGAESGPTQIASDGTTAVGFPQTSGALWGYIFSGAIHEGTTTLRHSLRLDGKIFGSADRPAITLHSNQGITFDLSRIRTDIPGLSIRSFDTLIGVSETVQDALKQEQGRSFEDFPEMKKVFDAQQSKVEFWVFLDGKQVFHEQRSSDDGAGTVHIPITAKDQFLTLVVTESDDTHAYDWALLACPELTLESAGQ